MPQPAPGPIPEMTGFTVDAGFSVIPPKRPAPVTAAVVVMLVVAVLALATGIAIIIDDMWRTGEGIDLALGELSFVGVFVIVAAVATAVFALMLRVASTGAQTAGFALLGGAAVFLLTTGFGGLARLSADSYGAAIKLPVDLSLLLGFVLTAAPLPLLAAPGAGRWFRDRRREITFLDPATPARRPLTFTLAIAFLTLTALLALTSIAANAGWIDSTNSIPSDSEGMLAEYAVASGPPVLLTLLVITGLAFGSDLARLLGYSVCGYYCLTGVTTVFELVVRQGGPANPDWAYVLGLAAGLTASLTAAVALFCLCRPQLLHWFDSARTPAAEAADPAQPASTASSLT